MATTHAEIGTTIYSTGQKDIWLWLWDGPSGSHRNIVFAFILRTLDDYQDLDIWFPNEITKARKLLDALDHSHVPLLEIKDE